ncbi:MAG: hypothetical protein JXR61_13940 [Prolixibacteraceae bacterium]|nr:hypothetical protein [Prolixibacteraceae bacterium]
MLNSKYPAGTRAKETKGLLIKDELAVGKRCAWQFAILQISIVSVQGLEFIQNKGN